MGLRTVSSVSIGEILPKLTKKIVQRQIDAFSGVRPHSIHTDPDWAKEKGFAAPLAQGMMSSAYVSQMMLLFLGEGFVKGGKMSVSFVKPVLAGDTLEIHGEVTKIETEGLKHRVTVEFTCENQQNVKTMIGTASGLVS